MRFNMMINDLGKACYFHIFPLVPFGLQLVSIDSGIGLDW